jgi:hypothetical protein
VASPRKLGTQQSPERPAAADHQNVHPRAMQPPAIRLLRHGVAGLS